LALLAAVAVPVLAEDAPQSKSAPAASARDTLRNVWVFFRDKGRSAPSVERVSARAELRRRKAGFRDSESGRPVNGDYIRGVERLGGALRTVFPWGNAASFSVNPSRLSEISSLPFVKAVSPVGVRINRPVDDKAGGLPKAKAVPPKFSDAAAPSGYDWHTEMLNVPLAHDYLRYKGFRAPGQGVLMAFFDGGFRLDHDVYKRLRDSSQVVAAYDFVDGDTFVADPDSVAKNPSSPYYGNDRHGTQTLSLAAAYAPGVYMGTAFGASFALARTEDDGVESHDEEDYWAAAMVWADSIGADIISSSLGYRDGFSDSADYRYSDMDGSTTIISIAAVEAVKRGMIVVNAMGNEDSRTEGTLTAPADVDGVVSVGAVTQNRTLSSFSSTGPTYDGRMKPEVVAPGTIVPVPEPYSPYSRDDRSFYSVVNGTSFSTPLISAVIALIMQANPDISAQAVKERLYASCSFAPNQNAPNNRFGYGIPNAALAVMDMSEIFLKVTDIDKRALAGATVEFGGQTYTADAYGDVLIKTQKPALPAKLRISYRESRLTDTVTVDALPFARVVEMDGKWDDGLKITPNIIRKNGVVRGRYTFSGADAKTPTVATVRTLTGKKVWSQRLRLHPDGSADFVWDAKSKGGTAAGVYIVVVRHGYSVFSERVVVSN
jgi:subtilisin family serine protease